MVVPSIPLPRYDGLRMELPVYLRLMKMWWLQRPDIVHVATEGPLGWSAISAAERLGLPISSSFHTNFHHYGRYYGLGPIKGLAVAYLRHFHNRTHCTMVPTDEMAEMFRRGEYRNVTVLARGVDTDLFKPDRRREDIRLSWGLKQDDLAIVYVGRLAKEKNVDLAVNAFEAMHEIEPRCHFVLVGDGPKNIPLKKRFPDFHYCGLRLGEDLAAHYSSGDVFLFPSITETFGNVVTEAMANGLLVLTYDYASGRQFVRSWENGVLARFDDSQDYIAKAREIMERRSEWKSLRTEARMTALGITWEAVVGHFEQLLFDVLARTKFV